MVNARTSGRGLRSQLVMAVVAVGIVVASGCGGSSGETVAATSTTAATQGSTTKGTTAAEDPVEEAGPLVIAHRGASGYAPEHTFAAYDLALEQGADLIEQDLQMTVDGVLVVLHDDVLDRVARGPVAACTGPVAEKTLAQIRQCDVGSWFNEAYPDRADPAFVGLTIPTMEDVLDRYGTDVRYYVEIKSPEDQPGMETTLLDLLDRAGIGGGGGAGSVLIQSFSDDSLRVVHGLRPDLPLVQLLTPAEPIGAATIAEISTYAQGVGPAKANVDAALVEAAHTNCLVVHPYTVDDPTEMAQLLAVGVDGMFTNVPDRLVATVRTNIPMAPPPCAEGS